jgi:hypothetical protein
MADESLIQISVNEAGETQYGFQSAEDVLVAKLVHTHESGWGIYNGDRIVEKTRPLIRSIGSAAIPIGIEAVKRRICSRCFTVAKSVVKNRSDCPSIFFCSQDCLTAADPFLDACGELLHAVLSSEGDSTEYRDHAALTFLTLWRSQESPNLLYRMLQLEAHYDIESAGCARVAVFLSSEIEKHCPVLNSFLEQRPSVQRSSSKKLQLIESVMRAIRYNAQPLGIPGLPPGSGVLTVLPDSLARVNHSCSPNVCFAYATSNSGSSSVSGNGADAERSSEERSCRGVPAGIPRLSVDVIVWLVATRTIRPAEPLCISYTSELCSPVPARRGILKAAFAFDCNCRRCTGECQGSAPVEPSDSSQSKAFQELASVVGVHLNRHMESMKSQQQGASTATSAANGKDLNANASASVAMTHREVSALLSLAERLLSEVDADTRDSSVAGAGRTASSSATQRSINNNNSNSNSNSNNSTYYLLHDAAMLAMRATQSLKQRSSNSAGSSNEDLQLEVTVKATWIISKCWDALVDSTAHDSVESTCDVSSSAGPGPSACRLPFLVSGVTAGMRVIKSMGAMGAASACTGLRHQVTEMASKTLALLELHYSQPDYYEKGLFAIGTNRSQSPEMADGEKAVVNCNGARVPNAEYIEKVSTMCRAVLDLRK